MLFHFWAWLKMDRMVAISQVSGQNGTKNTSQEPCALFSLIFIVCLSNVRAMNWNFSNLFAKLVILDLNTMCYWVL